MRFTYKPTFSDYWSLNYCVAMRQTKALGLMAAILLALYLASPLVPYSSQSKVKGLALYSAHSPLLILPGIVAFIFATSYFGVKKRWKEATELREEREFLFEEKGLRVKTKSTEGFMDWALFQEANVNSKLMYLMTAQRVFQYFPLSVVPDVAALKAFLSQKIPGAKF